MSDQQTTRILNPYVGPNPILDPALFYGRSDEIQELSDLILAKRIVLLHATSGAGKTSLLAAGLIPRLKERFQTFEIVRVNEPLKSDLQTDGKSPNRYIYSILNSLGEIKKPEQLVALSKTSTGLHDYIVERIGSESKPALLVIDQFEELLTLDPADWDVKLEFIQRLAVVLHDYRFWVILALRDDYLGRLDPFREYFPNQLNARYHLDLLKPDQALDAITKPPEKRGVIFERKAAKELIESLRTIKLHTKDGREKTRKVDFIEPVQLQVVCVKLWEKTQVVRKRDIIQKDIQESGNVDTALGDYYDQTMDNVSEITGKRQRDLRDFIGNLLISDAGKRSQASAGQEVDYRLDETVLQKLVDSFLLRKDERYGAIWYELAHDRLLSPVQRSNEVWYKENLNILQSRALIWDREGRSKQLLLRGGELRKANRLAKDNELERHEEEYLDESNYASRMLWFQVLIGIFFIIAIIVSAYLMIDANNANKLLDQAQTNASTLQYESEQKGTSEALSKTSESKAIHGEGTASAERDLKSTAELEAKEAEQTKEYLLSTMQVEATAQVPINKSRVIAAQALSLFDVNPTLSALLGVESYRVENTWEALNVLLLRILRDPQSKLRSYGSNLPNQPFWVANLAISSDGEKLAWVRSDGSLVIRDIASGTQIMHTRHTRRVSSVEYSQKGEILATGSYDRSVYIWQIDRLEDPEYEPIQLVGDPKSIVLSLSFNPNGQYLAAGNGEFVVIHDIQKKEQIRRMQHDDYIYSLSWSPDEELLAAGDSDGNLIVWDPSTGQRYMTPNSEHLKGVITGLAWSPDSQLLAAGDQNGNVIIFDMNTGELIGEPFQATSRAILGLDFSRNGRFLAAGGSANTIYIWEIFSRNLVIEENIKYRIEDLDFTNADGPNLLALGGTDYSQGRLSLFELLPADPLYEEVKTDQEEVISLYVYPSGELLLGKSDTFKDWVNSDVEITHAAYAMRGEETLAAVADNKGIIRIINITSGQIEQVLKHVPVNVLAFSHSGNYLATINCKGDGLSSQETDNCESNLIKVWKIDSGYHAELGPFPLDEMTISALVFHPLRNEIIAGSASGRLYRLNYLTEENSITMISASLSGKISSLSSNLNGSIFAVGGDDGKVLLVDAINYQPIGNPIEGIAIPIKHLTFDPDGKDLYSIDESGTVLRWVIDPDIWIQRSCELAGRNLRESELYIYLPGVAPPYKTCAQFP